MSHVTTVDVEVRDLDALALAAESIGLELVRGLKNYHWYGRFMGDYNDPRLAQMGVTAKDLGKCDHVLRVKDGRIGETYEIGVKQVGDSYRLLYDFFDGGNGLMEKVSHSGRNGEDLGKLVQAYTTEVAVKELKRKGFRVQRKTEGNSVRLIASR